MALDWLPVYPHRVFQPPRLSWAAFASVQNLDPLPNALPPTELTWHPHYPDRIIWRLRQPTLQPSVVWPVGPPFKDLRWKAVYPDRIVRRTFLAAEQSAWFGPNSAFLDIPKTGQWRPTYPARIWRKPPLVGGQSVWIVDATTLLRAANCVEWAENSLIRPEFLGEVLQRPQMVGIHQPLYLLAEDGSYLLTADGQRILLEDQSGIPDEVFIRPMMIEESLC